MCLYAMLGKKPALFDREDLLAAACLHFNKRAMSTDLCFAIFIPYFYNLYVAAILFSH